MGRHPAPLHLKFSEAEKELEKSEAKPLEWLDRKLEEIETQIQRLQEQSRQDGLK
jgi:hypothetical protein